jgi:5-methylcytosine-specific restriction enzyme A
VEGHWCAPARGRIRTLKRKQQAVGVIAIPQRVATHRPMGAPTIAQLRREYDRKRRDPESKRFYDSARWQKIRAVKLRDSPLCEPCLAANRKTFASTVHHRLEIRDHPELALEWDNLVSACASCHSAHHMRAGEDQNECMRPD